MRWHPRGEAAKHTAPVTAGATAGNGSVAGRGPAPEPAREPAPGPSFIGRVAEQKLFRKILTEVAGGGSAFIHVSGTASSGRRALLEQFRALAVGARSSPVIDFEADAGLELDELLERIAAGLEPEPRHLAGFFTATKRLRSREAGLPTRTSQALAVVRAGSSVVTQLAGAMPVKAVNAVIQSPLGDVLTEHAETKRTLSAVSDEFVTGLLELAQEAGPVVLLFSGLDFAPSNAKLLWLRRSLLPRIARAPVIVAVSTEPRFELEDVALLFGRMEQVRLDRFTAAEAEQFLQRHIDLTAASALGRAVLEDSDRHPERLAGYARYFREHPGARESDRLPMEARDLTAGGLVSGLLARISEPFLRDVLLHAAPLRWFNAELLAGVEEVCTLTPPPDGPHAAGLLDLGTRPSWITNVGGGWGIDVETRRRGIVDEFRRLHPTRFRLVHLHAAGYHVRRLRELEGPSAVAGAAEPDDEARVFAYQPTTHPTDRLRSLDYQAALGEWLYHLVALSPRRGFVRLADHVGEALAWDHPGVALALLDIGAEVVLPGSESLARQRLLEVARAMHRDRHAETLQLLREFAAAGSASAIADAASWYLVGTRQILLGRSLLTVHENFERTEKILVGGPDGVQAQSLRCLNLTRLAAERARGDQDGDAALALLGPAEDLARSLDPRMAATIRRTRSLILAGSGRVEEALAACDEALELLNRVGAAAEAALVLCQRADLRLETDRRAARQDLLRARSIYRQLVDPEAEAQVLLRLLGVALREHDDHGAAEHEAATALLRPDDFLLRNQMGNLYYQAGRHEQAVELYTQGLAIDREAVLFANRGRARLDWADQRMGHPPGATAPDGARPDAKASGEALRRLALDDLTAAVELDGDDLESAIALAELQRDLGDASGAQATAERVARAVVEMARALAPLPPRPPGEPSGATTAAGRLRELLVGAVSLLGAPAAGEILEAWTDSQPGDEEIELMLAIARHELSDGHGDGEVLAAALEAAGRAAVVGDPPRGRALVELAALHAQARHWREAKEAAERAVADETVRVQAEYMLDRLDQMHRREDEFGGEPEALVEELVVDIAEDVRYWFDPESPVGREFFDWMIEAFRRARQERVGLPAPRLWVGVRKELPPGTLQVVVDNVVRTRARLDGELLAAAAPEECRRRAGVEGRPGRRPWDGAAATWLDRSAAAALEQAAVAYWDPRGLVLAAIDQALEASPRFVSAEEAASLSGESWAQLSPSDYIARAEVVRELLADRVPPRELAAILHDHREALPEQRDEVIADAVARLAVPRATPPDLAAAFESSRFKRLEPTDGPDGSPLVEVGVHIAAGGDPDAASAAARRVLISLCGVLGVPQPGLRVELDPELRDGAIVVSVGGVTRLHACPAGEVDWWLCHPVAGRSGRAGVTGGGLPQRVARALAAVLWDDPALLLPDVETAQTALSAILGREPSERMTRALVEVLGRRVPLGPRLKLKRACEHVLDRSHSAGLRLPAARTFVSSPRRPIPDNLRFGIRETIDVDERGRLRHFAVRVQLHHEEESDLRVSLISPTGRIVVLHDGGDDLGPLRIGVDEEHVPGLALLRNEHAEGTWTLHVQDVATSDAGMLEEWALELTTVSSHPGQPAPSATPTISLSYAEREALARGASLERDLRSRRIEAECGAELWAALEAQTPGGRLERERLRLGTHLAQELGLRFGHSIHFTEAPELEEHDFRILVNGLIRASGDLRPGRYGQDGGAPAGGADAPAAVGVDGAGRADLAAGRVGVAAGGVGVAAGGVGVAAGGVDVAAGGEDVAAGGEDAAAGGEDGGIWVGPLTGILHRRLGPGVPGGFDAPDRLMRHVRASVREAAPEFADADWATAFLDRLGHTYHVTVPAARTAAGDDLLAAVLRELVTQGVPVADPRLMELVRVLVRSPERAAECQALAAAHPAHLGRTAGAMAEWLRERLDRADPDPGVPVLELGPTIEESVRAVVGACGDRVPVYAFSGAAAVLRRLEEARRELRVTKIAVVTAASLRRHVHRLIAAQFPTAEVIAREELDAAVPRTLIELTETELAGAIVAP